MEPETEAGAPRRCRIALDDLAEGFEMMSADVAGFLDLEGGEVVHISQEALRDLERLYETLPAALANAPAEQQREALLAAIDEAPFLGADLDTVLLADDIDRHIDTRYVALPEPDTRASYGDMEAFIATVADPVLQSELDRAIRGRGAFRRFRDELDQAETERWYAFRRARHVERAREWLADEGIELVTE
jgi:hypothetical protein